MIVVGGEALVDLVPAGEGAGLAPLVPRLGGGPYNVAVAAVRLGAPTRFLSRVSLDTFGDALLTGLRESGVATDLVQRGPEPTTLAVVGFDEGGSARYSFYAEGTADRRVVDPGPLPAGTTALALGTLGMVLEPGASVYERLLHREARRGVLTALDPNIRAGLIDDAEAYRARFATWLPSTSLLKLSEEDASWLAGDTALDRAVPAWLAAGVRAVVLTRGADGLTVFSESAGAVAVPTDPVVVADTIGAGDTVLGALLAWLHDRGVADPGLLPEGEWRSAAAFAARAAAITVSRPGADPPTRADLAFP